MRNTMQSWIELVLDSWGLLGEFESEERFIRKFMGTDGSTLEVERTGTIVHLAERRPLFGGMRLVLAAEYVDCRVFWVPVSFEVAEGVQIKVERLTHRELEEFETRSEVWRKELEGRGFGYVPARAALAPMAEFAGSSGIVGKVGARTPSLKGGAA